MLRVGLTGGLGSGKSTIGRLFAGLGVSVIDADEVGRRLMQPGEAVFAAIVEHFGPGVVRADGALNRRALAELAFSGGRLEELNRIVHPPVIAAQEEWMQGIFAADSTAIAMVESALVFEASGGLPGPSGGEVRGERSGSAPGWRERFDRTILVTASDELKVERFVKRSLQASGGDPAELAGEARRRLAAQIPDREKIPLCDWVIDNSRDLPFTSAAVLQIHGELKAASLSRLSIK